MSSESKYSTKQDEEFDHKTTPKRNFYKRIKIETKRLLAKDHFQNNVSIPHLTKQYKLSYSTIAHILKVYQENNNIFQSKHSQKNRLKDKEIIKEEFKFDESSQKDVKTLEICPDMTHYYPFAVYWALYHV